VLSIKVPHPPRLIVFAALATLAAGCQQKPVFQPPPPPTVTISAPLVKPVQESAEFNGQAFASRSVDLVARVQGFLQEVKFVDGADVKEGDELFVIEPQQYQAQVDLSAATVDQHKALLKSAEAEFTRQETLQKQAISTEANYDKALANRDSERAAVAEAQANLQVAKINLGYTSVKAPFSGRIGRRLIDPGNLVGAGSPTKLATISDVDTIYVYFTLNERDLLRVRRAMAAKGITRDEVRGMPVFGTLTGETGTPHEGKLDFVDTGLDTGTGTIQLRAVFENKDRVLLPGLYVKLTIPVGSADPAVLVPEQAINLDQAGAYVLVMDKDVVAQRRVTLGSQQGALRVIAQGLAATDKVIIDGMQNATPGRPVNAVEGAIAAPNTPAKG
jgi:RND family efflux transporter MFP subunit